MATDPNNPYAGDSRANPFVVNQSDSTAQPPPSTPRAPEMGTSNEALDGTPPLTTKPRKRPNGAPADGSIGGGAPVGVQQGFASISIRCFACGQKGLIAMSALKPSLVCRCGSADLDVDDEEPLTRSAVATDSCAACKAGDHINCPAQSCACQRNGHTMPKESVRKPCVYGIVSDNHSDDILAVYVGNPDGEPVYICGYHESRWSCPGAAKSPLNGDLSVKEGRAEGSTTAAVGTGEGYYIVNRNVPLAGPYGTAAAARQDMVVEGGTVVEFRGDKDPRGRSDVSSGPARPLQLGTGHVSSVDKTALSLAPWIEPVGDRDLGGARCSKCGDVIRQDEVASKDDFERWLMHHQHLDAAAAKVTQIAEGIRLTNPGMTTTAAFDLAERTVQRFPAVLEGSA